MNTFSVNIRCENAAFEGDARPEVIRLLRHVIGCLESRSCDGQNLLDVNGNTVGRFDLYEKE